MAQQRMHAAWWPGRRRKREARGRGSAAGQHGSRARDVMRRACALRSRQAQTQLQRLHNGCNRRQTGRGSAGASRHGRRSGARQARRTSSRPRGALGYTHARSLAMVRAAFRRLFASVAGGRAHTPSIRFPPRGTAAGTSGASLLAARVYNARLTRAAVAQATRRPARTPRRRLPPHRPLPLPRPPPPPPPLSRPRRRWRRARRPPTRPCATTRSGGG
jgi:hypothetical protein